VTDPPRFDYQKQLLLRIEANLGDLYDLLAYDLQPWKVLNRSRTLQLRDRQRVMPITPSRNIYRFGRVSWFRVQNTKLQPRQPQHRHVDAYCTAICRHSLPVLAELGTVLEDIKRGTDARSRVGSGGALGKQSEDPS
jgi:hypothetical protein